MSSSLFTLLSLLFSISEIVGVVVVGIVIVVAGVDDVVEAGVVVVCLSFLIFFFRKAEPFSFLSRSFNDCSSISNFEALVGVSAASDDSVDRNTFMVGLMAFVEDRKTFMTGSVAVSVVFVVCVIGGDVVVAGSDVVVALPRPLDLTRSDVGAVVVVVAAVVVLLLVDPVKSTG